MHDTADLMADPDDTGELVALAGSHDKSLELVPDGFHALLRDLGHEATRETTVAWIEERTVPPDRRPARRAGA